MCQSDHPNCERNARPYAEALFKAEFLLFSMGPWALSFYDQWPTSPKRERKKIAEGLLAASKVSLTKSKFYQMREY